MDSDIIGMLKNTESSGLEALMASTSGFEGYRRMEIFGKLLAREGR